MTGARERILGRLGSAKATQPDIDGTTIDQRIDEHYARWGALRDATQAECVDAFETALVAAHAEVWRANAAQWPAQLAQRIEQAGVRRLLLDSEQAEGAALGAALPATVEELAFARPLEQWKSELFDAVEAGFTVARSGIAATGTLVLCPDRGSPRTTSLVPPLHIALVHAATLHRDLHSATRAEGWRDGMPTNLVLVSGPSKTSDIQQTLAYGAHGPRRLWVVIVTEGQQAGHHPQGACR